MRRQVEYRWRLPEIMAANGMHNTTELVPRLQERGIDLSRQQVYRLAQQRPERVSLQVMAVLCDIFACSFDDLVTWTAQDVRGRKAAGAKAPVRPPEGESQPNVVSMNRTVRPKRARVISDDD